MYLITTMILLAVAMAFTLIRMVKKSTLFDRLMTLNLLSAKTVLIITIYGVYKNNIILLDVSLAYAIMGYLCITLLSRFILKGGRNK